MKKMSIALVAALSLLSVAGCKKKSTEPAAGSATMTGSADKPAEPSAAAPAAPTPPPPAPADPAAGSGSAAADPAAGSGAGSGSN